MEFLFKVLSALGIALFLMLTTKLLKLPQIETPDKRIKWLPQTLNTFYNIQSILQFLACLVIQVLLLDLFSSLYIIRYTSDSIIIDIMSILICIIIGICTQLSLKRKFRNL